MDCLRRTPGEILHNEVWLLGAGAQGETTDWYSPLQACHRRCQDWVYSGGFERGSSFWRMS